MRTDRSLLPHHQFLLDAAGITPEVIAARGYRSLERKADVRAVGFTDRQALVPCLHIPLYGPDGSVVSHQIRPDQPRIWQGHPLPIEMPASGWTIIDVPPAGQHRVLDPDQPLLVTGSVTASDAATSRGIAAISVHGHWLLPHARDRHPMPLPPHRPPLAGRTVVLAMDLATTDLDALAALFRDAGAEVRVLAPPVPTGADVPALDTVLATITSREDVLAASVVHVPAPPPPPDPAADRAGPYAIEGNRIVWRKPVGDDTTTVPLATFVATIREQVITDDGHNEHGELLIGGHLMSGHPLPDVRVPLDRFQAMDWVIANWGTDAIVGAGQGTRDRLREAIQRLSPRVVQRRVYLHPGWRRIAGRWCFLTAETVIGPDGPVADILVRLDGPAASIRLPLPANDRQRTEAVGAMLRLLDLAPDRIMVPLLGAVFRAVLAPFQPVDAVLFLVGPSGVRKSELAAVIQRCFGPDFDRLHLPAAWSFTANALERVAFDFKDCLLLIDDFAPAGTRTDVQQYHRTADRVIRGAGNAIGRGRMQADGTLRAALPPRALILGTGEDTPTGYSIRARMVIIEVEPGDVDLSVLSAFQAGDDRARPASALAGFIQWVAGRYEAIRPAFTEEALRLRTALQGEAGHARTPDALAGLGAAWRVWLGFARETGILTAAEAQALWRRVTVALGEIARRQAQHLAQEHPVDRFRDLLRAVLASGAGHVAGPDGQHPEGRPEAWGWRLRSFEGAGVTSREWLPQGDRIGWVDGDGLFLEPQATYQAIQRFGGTSGSELALRPSTLWKRLDEARLLVSTEHGQRRTWTVRRTLDGLRRTVLHLSPTVLEAPPDMQQSAAGPAAGAHGQRRLDDRAATDAGAAHEPDPKPAWMQGDGPPGQRGQHMSPTGVPGATTCARCGIRRTIAPSTLCPTCEEDKHDSAA